MSSESHQFGDEGACDIPGVAQGPSGKDHGRPEAKSALQLPAPRGCQGAPILALYGQNVLPSWLWNEFSLYFKPQGQCGSV